MKSNKEILDLFGSYVGRDAFDDSYGSIVEILDGTCPNKQMQYLIDLFNKFSQSEKEIILNYMFRIVSGTIFDFLRIFEEHEKYKIIYEENGEVVDLVEISESLMAEPIREGGWIEQFSQYSHKNNRL